MTQVWLAEQDLLHLEELAEDRFPLETGGVLAGYQADDGSVVVKAVFGPGPKAKHMRLRFEPDHLWQCKQLDEAYASSQGIVGYLGDWHTHPQGSPAMSWLDRWTLQNIAGYSASRCSHPLMLIGAGGPNEWKWAAHRFKRRSSWGPVALASELPLRTFSPLGK